MRTVYIADDGEMFDDIRLCREHEYNSVEKAIERFESYSKQCGNLVDECAYLGKNNSYEDENYITTITEDVIKDLIILNRNGYYNDNYSGEDYRKYLGQTVLIHRWDNTFCCVGTKDEVITMMINEVNEVFER